MLKSLKNVESAFQKTRMIAAIFMVFCISVLILDAYRDAELENKLLARLDKPYLLVGDQVHMIEMIENMEQTRPIEARGHIEKFHELYFNLDPDNKVIEDNVKKAMYMVDESGRLQYEHQKNNRYFSQIVTDNISQRIELNKPIELDTINNRVKFRLEATQQLTRSTSIVKRSLITEGFLRDNVGRTDNNRHGFLIEDWRIVENIDTEIIKR
jgi:conjugative transposon TraK protein